jgi:hypothetical protein
MSQPLTLYVAALTSALVVTSPAIGQQLETFTPIDAPGANDSFGQGINPRGDIVGFYVSAGVNHGFLLSR